MSRKEAMEGHAGHTDVINQAVLEGLQLRDESLGDLSGEAL